MNDVRDYYNDHVTDEDQRLKEHPFEIPVTLHFISKYLTPGQYIFDVACGTGHIARELLNKGYFVGLNDLSDKNVEIVRKRLSRHRNILFTDRSDAMESTYWNLRQWDCILLLGPLYHIISKEKRVSLLGKARKHLKPGGYVFSSFMTRMGAMVYGIKNNPRGILYPDGAEKLWKTGTDDHFVEDTPYFTNAWFSHPEEINPMIKEADLKPLHLAGAEGFFGERFELYHQMDEKLKEKWMQFVIDHCEDPRMVSHSKHLLSVAKREG
ncbi:MAG: class I SAM-dependent methyltransferase [Bacteroidota bacterium]